MASSGRKRPRSISNVERLYSENVRDKGATSQAVGWNSAESQELRFRELTRVVDRSSKQISVNDYGCGYGAHLQYLLHHGYDVAVYNGYDVSKPMLDSASKELHTFQGDLHFYHQADIVTEADYTFISGTFNVKFDAQEDEWHDYVAERLLEARDYSKRGFAFNLLSTYVDWKEPHLYYGDPCKWFDFCKRECGKRVSLLHDYLLHEWTILVRLEE